MNTIYYEIFANKNADIRQFFYEITIIVGNDHRNDQQVCLITCSENEYKFEWIDDSYFTNQEKQMIENYFSKSFCYKEAISEMINTMTNISHGYDTCVSKNEREDRVKFFGMDMTVDTETGELEM